MPTRTRADATGLPALSATRPPTVAPSVIAICTPVRSCLPSSVTSGDVPGASEPFPSGALATNRNDPAGRASKRNAPSVPVVAASWRIACWLQSDAPL